MNDQDLQHLKLLSIFHYIVGGIIFIFSSFPILHFLAGITLFYVSATKKMGPNPGTPMVFGAIFAIFAGTFILIGWTCAILMIISGYKLSKLRNINFCFIVACIGCLFMPLGTILGVFTIIVLMRPSVRELFQANTF